jgi:hypothetical protein
MVNFTVKLNNILPKGLPKAQHSGTSVCPMRFLFEILNPNTV